MVTTPISEQSKAEKNKANKIKFLTAFAKCGGMARDRAAAMCRVSVGTVAQWVSHDEEFAAEYRHIEAKAHQKYRDKIDKLTSEDKATGLPKDPATVRWAAGRSLEEFKPPAQQVNVSGAIEHKVVGGVDINLLTPKQLEDFVTKGTWPVELDRLENGTYGKQE